MSVRADLNVIRAGSQSLLLTAGGGDAVHLTREAAVGEEKHPAAADRHYLADLERGYDSSALAEPRWSGTTLCGRHWILMLSEDEDSDYGPASAPTCRRCLSLMDKLFPPPEPDDRLEMIVSIIADTVIEHGYAEMWRVPGDQQAALRSRARKVVKQRTGYPVRTLVIDSMVMVVCEPISEQHHMERAREVADAMGSVLTGKPSRPLPTPWRMSWDTWAAG